MEPIVLKDGPGSFEACDALLYGVAILFQRLRNLRVGGFLVTVDASVVSAVNHLRRIADPTGHFGDRDSRVQPPRDARVPQVVRAPSERRIDALRREGKQPRFLPHVPVRG